MKEIKNVVICGAGLMGKGLAQVFSGCEDLKVTVQNRSERDVHGFVRQNLEQLRDKGIVTDAEIEARLSRIYFTTNMQDDAVKNADLVIESVAEEMETKQNLFATLEGITRDDCIYATNTSVMSPTEIASKCKHKDRVVGAHFWNPPYLIPLVEVVKTADTSEEAVQAVMDVLTKAGKKPVLCKKDVPGFIANRMQHALWREAISIVERGIADAQTVDDAVKYSFGLRLPQLAPLENSDMVGTQLTWNIHNYVLKDLEDSHVPSPLLQENIGKGKLGFASGEGFLEWTPEKIEKCRRDLNEYLIRMIYGV
ncbi:3-hydroxyacyl-CoA dehydrogenase family protein [Parasporobacterium paucivorans]|uniref:3-hydroxybutyryl-CoA dehydrogenase n=1 Tax=Parasporobacterium paucivorans DSM 15970 TaxID=1122934 RepID=A0A1M6BY89_9FIRM|nr:3-hydroxyacyl-CoA dehydrogenase family protein [Parasporobacterium paucivorans]SHI53667.1 3-hydroxybutyryl-CoA dehydrogenase [Parasporobacterium paucivorans DSM 15970]